MILARTRRGRPGTLYHYQAHSEDKLVVSGYSRNVELIVRKKRNLGQQNTAATGWPTARLLVLIKIKLLFTPYNTCLEVQQVRFRFPT